MENRYTNTEEFKRLKAEKEAQRNEEQEDYIDHFRYKRDDDGECHCSDPGCPCDGSKNYHSNAYQ